MDLQLVKKRLEHAERSFRTILTGGKAALHHDHDEWMVEQLQRMFDKHYISSPPRHYVYYDDESVPDAVNTLHPMPHKLRGNRLRIINELGAEDAKDVDILGSHVTNRNGQYHYEVPDYVRGFVCPRGDLYSAHEMIIILLEKIKAYEAGHMDDPILRKPLVISNQRGDGEQGYWSPLLKACHIENGDRDFASKLGVFVAERRRDSAQTIKEKLPRDLPIGPRPVNGSTFKAGSNLFFHTTTLEKVLMHMEGFRGTSAIIRPLHLTGVIAESPEEKAHTAEGNALSKHAQAQLAAAQVPDEMLVKRFRVSRDKAATFVDDTFGYFVDKRLLQHFDLTGLEHIVDRDKWLKDGLPFPHVEIGPIINACNGHLNFCNRVNEAFAKLEKAVDEERMELQLSGKRQQEIDRICPTVNRTFVVGSVIIHQPFPPHYLGMGEEGFAKFVTGLKKMDTDSQRQEAILEKLKKLGAPKYVVTGSHRFYFNDRPLPEGAPPDEIETYNYQIPIGQPKGVRKSRAEYISAGDMTYEPQRKADLALFHELGGDITQVARKGFGLGHDRFNIVISNPEGPGENKDAWSRLILSLNDDRYFVRTMRKRLDMMEDVDSKIVKDSDGILVMPDAAPADDIAALAEKKFRFWSIIVGKQTDPRDMNKPIVFFDPHDTWKEEIDEYKYLYTMGALKEKPDYIFRVARTEDEVLRHFNHARENRYPPVELEEKERPEMKIPESGKFNVAIFCSASFENEHMLKTTYNLSYNLAKSGFGIVYGGGSRYMMGMIYEGANAARDDGVNDIFVAGSNTDHLVLREGKFPEGLSHYYDAPNIYKRMEYMFRTSDCAVIAPGGPGTLQELTGFVMYMAKNFDQVKDKEMVIVNRPVTLSKGNGVTEQVNYYDLLTKFLPPEKMRAMKIHVVADEVEAKAEIEKIRERSEKAKSMVYVKQDTFKDAWMSKVRKGAQPGAAAMVT